MRIQILLTVVQSLHREVKEKFGTDIKKSGHAIPVGVQNFWNIFHDNNSLFKKLIGDFNPKYLHDIVSYKNDRQYEVEKKMVTTIDDERLLSFLNYIGIAGNKPIKALNNFLETFEEEERTFHHHHLNITHRSVKVRNEPLKEIDQLLENRAKLLSQICSPRLLEERFWFYFYGYEKFKMNGEETKTWPLVKLLLKFTGMDGIEVRVEIDNTPDTEHHDYVGKTDFLTSRDDVLVINCRTYPDFSRQLNIKIHIGTGFGDIFLGQYMNYESEGRIISGSILLQRISKDEIDPQPKVYHIDKLSETNEMYKKDVEGINKNILQYLHDKKINVRRTSLRAGHSLITLERWLKHQNKNLRS